MNWIIANIAWIKDMLWIIFTLVATVIAILTYRRARYTLLQPLRSEVVKRQTELLMSLLEFVTAQNGKAYLDIDYMGIIACNAFKLLKLCDFVITEDEVEKEVEESICGFMILKTDGEISTFSIPTDPFCTDDQDSNDRQVAYRKKLKDQIKNKGSISELEEIYLTTLHVETTDQLAKFRDSPFMPKSIQDLLTQLLQDIGANIRGPLLDELKKFIIRVSSMKTNPNDPIQITYQAIYNAFMMNQKSHIPTINELTIKIREYLLVDTKWS